MSRTDQLSRVTPYVRRLLQDEYIHEQIGDAITGLRRSSRRAKGRRPSQALKDRRLRSQLGGAAGSLTRAARALGQPAPPKRRRMRGGTRLAAGAAAAVAGGAAWAWRRRSATSTNPDESPRT